MTVVLLILAALLLSYANGANDNFKAVATVYGSSTLSYRAALRLATAAQLAGSIASVFLAGALLKAFSGKGLVPDATVADPRFLLAVGLAAAATVLLATRLGMPVSTTHAMIGGLVGAGLAVAPTQLLWSGLAGKFFLPLLISPVLATAGAAIIYPIARSGRKRLGINEGSCVCIGERVEPVAITPAGAMVLARTGIGLTADQAGQCQRRYEGSVVGISAQRILDSLHLTSAAALGFARGLNDTPKIMAILVGAAWSGLGATSSLLLIAVVMAAGGLLHSGRIAATLGTRITQMNHGQGFVANIVASSLVIGASVIGSPVSTTHISTGAIFGIGLWTGKAHWNVVGQIVGAWVATLPLALLLGYVVALACVGI
ncbi:MAG: inorganic phosphate transporter [Planctomycetes bacterium]|nr:inorganic phosphate transporter [Planctomycetota bacterium]